MKTQSHPGDYYIDNLEDAVQHIAYTEGKRSYHDLTNSDKNWLTSNALSDEVIEAEDLFSSDYNIDIYSLLQRAVRGHLTPEGLGKILLERVQEAFQSEISGMMDQNNQEILQVQEDKLFEETGRFIPTNDQILLRDDYVQRARDIQYSINH